MQVRKKLAVDEDGKIVAGQRIVVIEGAVSLLWRGPVLPAIWLLDDGAIGFARERGFTRSFVLQIVEIFEKQNPRVLLGVIELRGASRLFPEDVVDVFECLFEQASALTLPYALKRTA